MKLKKKTKRKLKKWVKIALIIIVILTSTLIYQKTGFLGILAQSNIIYLVLCVSAWIWLLFGQFVAIYFIVGGDTNENK